MRDITATCITDKSDFGDPSHSKHSEPYFYETAYKHAFQSTKLVVDRENRSFAVLKLTPETDKYINDKPIPLDLNEKAYISDKHERSKLCLTTKLSKQCKTYAEALTNNMKSNVACRLTLHMESCPFISTMQVRF